MSMKSVAVTAAIICVFVAPAFADDADKAAVLRDIGRSASQGVQPSDANALAVPATRAQRPAQVRAQRPAQVIEHSLSPFDANQIGHN